ncbi:BglII/BstYI family type II restriction endonuclease [Agrobacterium tumefaciens]|uniref:BglII/BstYI family type II restriction endonuclease n=1 Tax=Agrobacterium tumefaciens TaxID=358 RepID=UPI0015769DE1|nr:BglII/BstYI family type II restriction endonuclease [Agrobacterium tumefaciens]NTZ91504.1 restriction endonuclease [Agrobacterium tumefaciens]
MFEKLVERGFQIEFLSHAKAILSVDFAEAVQELEGALLGATIPVEEIIAGGGGEAKGTQRLRRALNEIGWPKTEFVVERRINGVPRESQSHEVDHVRTFPDGSRIALEIEWNNKDPFFDRDLENFKRLHADGAISIGIIVTRGKTLHDNMRAIVRRFLYERQIQSFDDIRRWGYDPTSRQRRLIQEKIDRMVNPLDFKEAFVGQFVSDKFGEATTHWRKLDDRLRRGVGNPCPLLLIGLPVEAVTFDEGESALLEVEAADNSENQ